MHHLFIQLRPLYPLLLSATLFLSGCFGGGRPAATVIDQYLLEYPAPLPVATSPLASTITVERLMGIPPYTTTAMMYQPAPLIRDEYQSHRWRTTPADMVNSCLARDVRNSGIFRGVFTYRDAEASRYRLKGTVDEFLEQTGDRERVAVLAITVTLLDTSPEQPDKHLLFQRQYRIEEPFTDKSPPGLARAMSSAMAKVSALLLADLKGAVTVPAAP